MRRSSRACNRTCRSGSSRRRGRCEEHGWPWAESEGRAAWPRRAHSPRAGAFAREKRGGSRAGQAALHPGEEFASIHRRLPERSIKVEEFVAIEDGPRERWQTRPLDHAIGLGTLSGLGRPAKCQAVGAINLASGVAAGFASEPAGEGCGKVKHQGVIHHRQGLERRGRDGATRCGRRRVGAVECVEQVTSATAKPCPEERPPVGSGRAGVDASVKNRRGARCLLNRVVEEARPA